MNNNTNKIRKQIKSVISEKKLNKLGKNLVLPKESEMCVVLQW